MSTRTTEAPDDVSFDRVPFDFGLTRREAVRVLGGGLLIAVMAGSASAAQAPGGNGARPRGGGGRGGRGGGGGARSIAARVHVGKDGVLTVMTGKVECGQGARAELTQAAAEELRVPAERVRLVMADTSLVPDDGMTAGSRTTPSTVPSVRQGAAAARDALVGLACKQWDVPRGEVEVRDGAVVHAPSRRELSYAELASSDDAAMAFDKAAGADVVVTPVKEWRVLGTPVARPNGHDIVVGNHHYPSDVARPGMLYGKVLRPPSSGATLTAIDLGPAKGMAGVVAVRDGAFVGVAAPTSFRARQALDAIADTAKWDAGQAAQQPSSDTIYEHLRKHVKGGMPANPFAEDVAQAAKSLRQSYRVAYVQHAPLEPRAAVAEWDGGKLTVWTGTQNPFGVRGELAGAFRVAADQVRVVVPDFGGGFGGKHSGEAAVEAARLAQAAGKPVSLRWTRAEEFTWAYFRPAALIEAEASLAADGSLATWHFVNVNSGASGVETPYRVAKGRSRSVQSEPPLRHGSYRGLASTANTFARECFMDELAEAAGQEPLAFRLAHLNEPRLRAVLEAAAKHFDWDARSKRHEPNVGVGLACGTEKGAYVAACAEVAVEHGEVTVRRVCQAFECGAVLNPANLRDQNAGAIVMALGPLLREETRFEAGKVLNASFRGYAVPRFADVPEIDVHLLDRPDLPSSGAGETPLIATAPAVANAVFRAAGVRVRDMPMRLPKA